MSEYLIKFWTKSGKLSGARIFASSSSQAMQIAKDTYDALLLHKDKDYLHLCLYLL